MARKSGIGGMIVSFQKVKCRKGKCTVKFGHGKIGDTMAERKVRLPKGISDKEGERILIKAMEGTYIDI